MKDKNEDKSGSLNDDDEKMQDACSLMKAFKTLQLQGCSYSWYTAPIKHWSGHKFNRN